MRGFQPQKMEKAGGEKDKLFSQVNTNQEVITEKSIKLRQYFPEKSSTNWVE